MDGQEIEMLRELLETHTRYINQKIEEIDQKIDNLRQEINNKTRFNGYRSFLGGVIGGFVAVVTNWIWRR